MRIDEKLAIDAFKTDKESHITIHQDICRTKCAVRYCIAVCPGHLYEYDEVTREIRIEYAGCLECGTCKIACEENAIEWKYPRGEHGVQYRYG
jgi:ferredoxin like protein